MELQKKQEVELDLTWMLNSKNVVNIAQQCIKTHLH